MLLSENLTHGVRDLIHVNEVLVSIEVFDLITLDCIERDKLVFNFGLSCLKQTMLDDQILGELFSLQLVK